MSKLIASYKQSLKVEQGLFYRLIIFLLIVTIFVSQFNNSFTVFDANKKLLRKFSQKLSQLFKLIKKIITPDLPFIVLY
jgi:hypothetical protein